MSESNTVVAKPTNDLRSLLMQDQGRFAEVAFLKGEGK